MLTVEHMEENKSFTPREKILVSHKIKCKMKFSQIIGNLQWLSLQTSQTDAGGEQCGGRECICTVTAPHVTPQYREPGIDPNGHALWLAVAPMMRTCLAG